MICVAIVFTIAFIVIVGGIFGIFWGMHETEENRAIVVSKALYIGKLGLPADVIQFSYH